jgi:hypothetical protein
MTEPLITLADWGAAHADKISLARSNFPCSHDATAAAGSRASALS